MAQVAVTPWLAQVLEVERPQQVGDLALAGVGDVVDVCAQPHHVVLRLVEVAGGGLGGGHQLDQVPEEADVEMPLRVRHRAVVQFQGGEALESVVVGHRATQYAAARVGTSPGRLDGGARDA